MSIKSRNILMILGGGYLIYIGTQLVLQTRQSHPQNETMFVAFGAGFAIFGAIVALFNLWEIWKDVRGKKKAEDDDSYIEMIEFDDEPEPMEDRVRERKNHVQMVKVERKEETTLDIEEAKEEPVADGEEKDNRKAGAAPTDKNETDEGTSAESTSTEELELNPDEAEEVFPTEEIKLERI